MISSRNCVYYGTIRGTEPPGSAPKVGRYLQHRVLAAVDGFQDGFLFLGFNAQGCQRFPCTTIRTNQGFVILPGKGGVFRVGLATLGADRRMGEILLHNQSSVTL